MAVVLPQGKGERLIFLKNDGKKNARNPLTMVRGEIKKPEKGVDGVRRGSRNSMKKRPTRGGNIPLARPKKEGSCPPRPLGRRPERKEKNRGRKAEKKVQYRLSLTARVQKKKDRFPEGIWREKKEKKKGNNS